MRWTPIRLPTASKAGAMRLRQTRSLRASCRSAPGRKRSRYRCQCGSAQHRVQWPGSRCAHARRNDQYRNHHSGSLAVRHQRRWPRDMPAVGDLARRPGPHVQPHPRIGRAGGLQNEAQSPLLPATARRDAAGSIDSFARVLSRRTRAGGLASQLHAAVDPIALPHGGHVARQRPHWANVGRRRSRARPCPQNSAVSPANLAWKARVAKPAGASALAQDVVITSVAPLNAIVNGASAPATGLLPTAQVTVTLRWKPSSDATGDPPRQYVATTEFRE